VAGLLDSKSRVIDFALTPVGRAQLANGSIRFVSATVSDRASFYEEDTAGGPTDATERVYFETYSTSNDQITLESDDSGQLLPFRGSNFFVSRGGSSYDSSGENLSTSSRFASLGQEVASDTAASLSAQQIVLTDDLTDPSDAEFSVSGKDYVFVPAMTSVERDPEQHIDQIESLLFDKRLSRKKNFQFLPPVNDDGTRLGRYRDIRQQILGTDEVSSLLTSPPGRDVNSQLFISRLPTRSSNSPVALQIFETGKAGKIRKLDLIDFGEFEARRGTCRVVFAGRVFENSFGFPVFLNLLTLVIA